MELAKDQTAPTTPQLRVLELPPIGAIWPGQGGRFMGIMKSEDGASEVAIILAEYQTEELTHADAIEELAAFEADGHKDFTLPTRRELFLLYVNGKEHFKPDWYWSIETHAAHSDYAWYQYFNTGGQDDWLKDGKLLGCGVRRLSI